MDCTSLTNPGCLRNMQSPIHLERNATAKRECNDKHRMNFVTGSCNIGQLDFQILPHGKNQLISSFGTYWCDRILTYPSSFDATSRSVEGLSAQEL